METISQQAGGQLAAEELLPTSAAVELVRSEFPENEWSEKTARNQRYQPNASGPPFIIVGRRVFYPKSQLRAWARSRYSKVVRSRRELVHRDGEAA